MKSVLSFIAVGGVLLLAQPVWAQDAGTEVTIVSTRLRSGVPNAEYRKAHEGQDVAAILQQVPGVVVLDGGVAGSRSELYVRGADANFTAVLIEGVPVNDLGDSRGGAYDFSTVAGDEIGAVTLGQGPLSALYGSGALAGVVNIGLGWPEAGNGGYRVAVSGDDEYAVSVGGRVAPTPGWTLSGLVRNGADGDHGLGQWRELSSVSGRLVGKPHDSQIWTVFGRAADSDREGFDVASGGILYAPAGDKQWTQDRDRLLGVGLGQTFDDHSRLDMRLSAFRRDEDLTTPANPEGVYSGTPAVTQSSRFDRVQATAIYRVQGDMADYSAGVEAMTEQGRVEAQLDFGGGFVLPASFARRRNTLGMFGEGQVRLGHGWLWRAGVRADSRDGDTPDWSTRSTVQWTSDNGRFNVGGTWGRSLKVPSFYALGDPLVGSPDLRNEESEGADVKAGWRIGAAQLSVTAHSTTYRNLIDFDFETFKLVNRGEVEITGVDVELGGEATAKVAYDLRLSSLHNRVNGVDDGLLHRPDLTAAADVTWQVTPALSVRLANRYVGKRQSGSIPTGAQTLEAYVASDFTAAYRFGGGVSLGLSVGNVADARYETISGFRARGRHAMISLSGKF